MAVTTAWNQTAGDIINAVALETIGQSSTDPFSSTDPLYLQLVALLKNVGRELVLARDWKALIKEMSFTGTGAQTEFDLPDDFARVANGSGWRRADQTPMANPLTSQEWQYLKAWSGSVTLSVLHRFVGNQIQFFTAPANGAVLYADYVSRYWIASNGSSTSDAEAPTNKDDKVILEPLMVQRLLKYKWLVAKSLPGSDEALAEYRQAYEGAASNEPGQIIRLGGGDGFRFVSDLQLPDTGWGSP